MTRIIIYTIALLFLSGYANAQAVKGKVVDSATGNPIAQANIFLKGSSKGTTSNAKGEFVLYTNETKIPLVVSYIGYQPDTIYNYHGKTVTVKLNQSAQELREVIVGNGDMPRKRQMKIFVKQFIGERNKDCVIMNPDDINFIYHNKTGALEATVYQPLLIHNKKLGYKITYFLSSFSYGPEYTSYMEESPHMETSYKGNYIFEEDTLGLTPSEMKKIHKARDKAYYGSRMHFIRLVLAGRDWQKNWKDDEEKTKFRYGYGTHNFNYRNVNFIFYHIRANKEQLLNNIIATTDGYWFMDKPSGGITYDGYEYSQVTFKSGEITLNRQPVLTPDSYNESTLIWCGKMGDQRVGDLLPLDFEPSE